MLQDMFTDFDTLEEYYDFVASVKLTEAAILLLLMDSNRDYFTEEEISADLSVDLRQYVEISLKSLYVDGYIGVEQIGD